MKIIKKKLNYFNFFCNFTFKEFKKIFIMKTKIFLTIIFAVSMQFCFGQEYHKLVDTNKMWSVLWINGTNPYYKSTHFIKFQGDTIINDTMYKKVLKAEDEFHNNWYLNGFIREDSTQKVYYKNYLEANEKLIYDFQVNINDTFYYYKPELEPPICLVVNGFDSIKINNYYRKVINLSCPGAPYIAEKWIEGIGSTEGVIYCGYSLIIGGDYELLCFYENDTLSYIDSSYNECYYNTYNVIENISVNSSFIIYPNPATQTINISFNNQQNMPYTFELYNNYGEIIFKKQIINSTSFELSNISNGVYFYIIKDNKNFIIHRNKLIITK